MTRRRLARRILGVLAFVGFPALVVFSFRPSGTKTEEVREPVAGTLLSEAEGIRDRLRFAEFDYREHEGNEEVYRLHAAEAIAFSDSGDQVFRLKDARFESREKGTSRSVVLFAPRAELAQGSKAFRVFDGVRIEGEGMELSSASFRYDPVARVFRSEGPVSAAGSGLVGGARHGELATASGVVTLSSAVRLRGRDDGGMPLDLSADRTEVSREGGLAASGGVVLKSGELVVRGGRLVRQPEGTGDRIGVSGGVILLVSPRHASEIPGPLLATGERLDLQREANGRPVRAELSADDGSAVILSPPTREAGPRRAVCRRFEASFQDGALRELVLPAALHLAEAGAPHGARMVRAERGRLTFEPDGRTVAVGNVEGDVRVEDGSRASVEAPRAGYRGADQNVVFAGEPGRPASYRDAEATVAGSALTYWMADGRLEAAGSVRASFRGRAAGQSFLSGAGGDAPTFSESDFLRAQPQQRRLLLTGSVKAWQEENVLRARSVSLDETERLLRAEGDVNVFLRRRPAGSKAARAETVTASGAVLTHREADRLVRIEGNATIVSGPWTIRSVVADVRLGADRSLESAEARGDVVVEDRMEGRRGEGSRALWRAAMDAISLEGTPATALDGKGSRMSGAVLTFHRGRSRVDVETLPGIPSEGILKPEGS